MIPALSTMLSLLLGVPTKGGDMFLVSCGSPTPVLAHKSLIYELDSVFTPIEDHW